MIPIQLPLPTPLAVGPVNAWLLRGEEPALIDVGPFAAEAWEALLAGLAAHGLAPRDLRHILITHAHVDHFGNAARLAELAPDATLYAPDLAFGRALLSDSDEEWERHLVFNRAMMRFSGIPEEQIAGSRARLKVLRNLGRAVPATRWLTAGERVALGDGERWEVVALPGHTITQVGFWQREAAWFISADHLLPRISTNALVEPPAPGQTERPKPLLHYIETHHWMAGLPPQHIFPGHGSPFEDQRPLIARRLHGMEKRLATIRDALAAQPRTVVELIALLFPDLRDEQLFLAASEVIGHLDVLEARGLVGVRGESVGEYFLAEERVG